MPAPTTNEQVTLQASGSKGKALPQNIEAEKTVLSACLLSTGVFEEVSLKLRPEDFYRPAHRIIFETMRDMNARSVPIDVISVADSLSSKRWAGSRICSTFQTTRLRSPVGSIMPIS